MKLLLHIGTDKTGSTAIQKVLWENRDWFLAHRVYIPQTGMGVDNGHATLLQSLGSESLSQLTTELNAVDEAQFDCALLSWEGMCKFRNRQIASLMRAVADHQVELLVYLRDQAEIVQSAHLQWVQMNPAALSVQSLSVPKSPAQRLKQYLFLRHPQRNYFKLLKRWQSARNDLSFNLRRFAREHLVEGDIVADFLAQCGLTADGDFVRSTEATNPSIDVETALLIERWRKASLSEEEMATRLDLAIAIAEADGTGNRFFLDKAAVDATRRYFRASNARAANLAGYDASFDLAADSRCWRTEPFSSARNRATTRDQKVDEENAIPTLHSSAAGEALDSKLLLQSGWSGIESWGVWSDAGQSIVQFRIPKQPNVSPEDILELSFVGKYFGPNSKTEVKANELELGWRDLSAIDGKLQVPLTELGPLQRLTLQLTHEAPTSPAELEGGEDTRELAFALCSVSYRLVHATP